MMRVSATILALKIAMSVTQPVCILAVKIAMSVTQPVCVFVALGIQHATLLRHIFICDLPRCTIFFHIIS